MTPTASKRVVVDADIARAAKLEGTVAKTAIACARAMEAILSICHRAVMTTTLQKQWRENASHYSKRWLGKMYKLHKVVVLSDPFDSGSAGVRLARRSNDEDLRKIMLEDAHLIGAALAEDRVVISRDDTARRAFADQVMEGESAAAILWANPEKAEENVVEWLNAGAPDEPGRRLGNYRK